MAIQMRRGDYEDFDASMMAAGEFAFVQSGDPDSATGKRIYACFSPGDVQKMVTEEEMENSIESYLEDSETYREVIPAKIEEVLEDHPEWVTTVEDGSLTADKFSPDVTTFTDASTRANIASGDSIKTIWGKIKKYFTDLGAAAFKAVANNLTTTADGSVLDARQGKALDDKKLNLTGGTMTGDITITKSSPVVQLNSSGISGRLVASDSGNFGLWDVTHGKYVVYVDSSGVVGVPPVNVKDSISFTKSTNCSAVTLLNAYRIGNALFVKFQVTPNAGIDAGANVDITVSGFTPMITSDYRLGPGIIGTGIYMSWITSATNIRCRYMSSNAWSNSNTPIFSGVIPISS